MKIERIFEVTQSQANDINMLRRQLTPGCAAKPFIKLSTMLSQPNLFFLGLVDQGKILGMASLVTYECPMGACGVIEDVVVDGSLQGKGWGKNLTQGLIDIAQVEQLDSIQLTSHSSREAANAVYSSLGLELRDTNCYTLKLKA